MSKKTRRLKDGTEVVIRPLDSEDLENSYAFFNSLLAEEKAYLRIDVSDKNLLKKRIKDTGLSNFKRIVATIEGQIVADGALELRTHGWEKHIGDLRLIVSQDYQGQGLGMLMAEELYMMAAKEPIEDVVIKVMAPQTNAIKIFEQLGFHKYATLPKFVKDVKGQRQDLIILRCNLDELWNTLETYFKETENRDMH